ncbi:MAG: radical SAM protein [Proteobacteria bacterium]|nr:radical SAM protein [Pseudomonadota bacterium]
MSLITLIRPPVLVAKWAHTTPTCPPIGLAYLAAALEGVGMTVKAVYAVGNAPEQMLPADDQRFLTHGQSTDEIIRAIDPATKVIGISCMFSHEWPITRALIASIRQAFPDAPIIGGGEHITALPEFSLTDCSALDVGVIGEGEETLAELVAALLDGRSLDAVNGIAFRRDGEVVLTEARPRLRALDDIQLPSWNLFPLASYLDNGYGFGVNRGRSMPVLATRGCPYQCTFCSNPTMWGTRWVSRAPERVLAEMLGYHQQYKIDNFDFYDLTAIVKKDWIVRFCNMVINSGVDFTWQLPSGTRSEAIDSEVSELLYKSGCRNMSYAPESGSPAVLERIKKKIDLRAMEVSISASVRNNINCKANILIGFPHETHAEIFQTLWFTVRLAAIGIHDISFSPFSPYPGSELFSDMQKSNLITDYSDEFFYGLAAYTDITKTTSCSEYISNRALGFYRIFGMLMFYGMLYMIRPWRLIRTIRNVFGEQQESRLEMSLRDLYIRLTKSKEAAAR